MELLTAYDNIIFVDAHVGPGMEDLHCSPVTPHYSPSAFTHHMTPSALLAFMGAAYGREPRAHLVSILGHDFGLQGTISPKTRALVGPAVDLILDLMGQEDDR
jgi:Ni,Fe-hydrogenase maturation factor